MTDQFGAQVRLIRLHGAVVDHDVGIASGSATGDDVDRERARHGVRVGDGGFVDDGPHVGRGVLRCLR
ncbi:MAG: hypothetical protein AN487_23175, partial [Anabaena sp. CRKS33]